VSSGERGEEPWRRGPRAPAGRARLDRLAASALWYRSYRVAAGVPLRAAGRRHPRTWLYPADPDGHAAPGDPQERGLVWSRIDLRARRPESGPRTGRSAASGSRAGPSTRRRGSGRRCVSRGVSAHRTRRAEAAARPSLLALLDGWDYVHLIPTAAILDAPAAEGRIAPVVAAFVASPVLLGEHDFMGGRAGLPAAGLGALLAAVLPWARRFHGATANPRRTAIGGLSLGGFAAAALAVGRPDRRILSMGSNGAGEPTVARRLGGLLGLPVIHLDASFHLRPGRMDRAECAAAAGGRRRRRLDHRRQPPRHLRGPRRGGRRGRRAGPAGVALGLAHGALGAGRAARSGWAASPSGFSGAPGRSAGGSFPG
jgi:hypothetical protein